jgi:23S rRNA (uracil1939-C5)-methyltransferase
MFHHNPQVGTKIVGHSPLCQLAGPPTDSAHPVRAFRQAAHTLLAEARDLAVSSILKDSPKLVLDLYCGTGDLAELLPENIGWIGIEQSRDAVTFASHLREGSKVTHRVFLGAVEQRLRDPAVLSNVVGPYALYINPPRSGLSLDARKALFDLITTQLPTSVAYLSCSASGLARDLRFFEELGYSVALLQPYDFFPQTEHFETLALLRSPG